MIIRLHADARAELREARKWYLDRSPLTAMAFAHTIDNAVSAIARAPSAYPPAEYGTRKLVLQRFPFNIFFRESEEEIVIIAVSHQKRRPGYWSRRTALP